MVWLEPTDPSKTATKPCGQGVWTDGVFAMDENLWMADWELEMLDWRRHEDRLHGHGIVDQIMKEAHAAPRGKDAAFLGSAACGPHYSRSNICKEVEEKMKFDMQSKLDEYLRLLEQIKQKTTDERTAVALLQEVSKDRRSAEIREERETKGGDAQEVVPATEKQKQFMKKLGIRFPATVTKQEASMLLDEELAKNGE